MDDNVNMNNIENLTNIEIILSNSRLCTSVVLPNTDLEQNYNPYLHEISSECITIPYDLSSKMKKTKPGYIQIQTYIDNLHNSLPKHIPRERKPPRQSIKTVKTSLSEKK